jgi:hypothetical protein
VKTVEVWCDKSYQGGNKVPATRHELALRLGDQAGEMDLSEERYQELSELLRPWFAVCRDLSPEAGQQRTSTGKIKRGPGTAPGSTASRKWRARMRAWSDSLGLVNRVDPDYPAWQTVTGKHYYPADLEDAFIAHEAGREAEALELAGQFKPQAR